MSSVDARRAHHKRPDFLRTAGLNLELAAPLPNSFLTTWSESARIRSCFTQINSVALNLNQLNLHGGQLAAAEALAKQLVEVSALLDEFRAGLADTE